jgi:hypothetical protein
LTAQLIDVVDKMPFDTFAFVRVAVPTVQFIALMKRKLATAVVFPLLPAITEFAEE